MIDTQHIAGKVVVVDSKWLWHPENPDYIEDANGEVRLIDDEVRINLYQSRVREWFFDVARKLADDKHNGYVVLQIAISQVEGMAQYREGSDSRNNSARRFTASMNRILAQTPSEPELPSFYTFVRCGMFHSGFTCGPVFVCQDQIEAISTHHGFVTINPIVFLELVEREFDRYIAELFNPYNFKLRKKFLRLWNRNWEKLNAPAVAAFLES